jgi:hypothetical protein
MPIYAYRQIQINYYRERQEETLGDLFGVIETLVDIHGVIDHVGLVEKLDLRLEDLLVLMEPALLEKLQNWEDQVPVQVRRYARSEVVARHASQLSC